VLNSAIQRFYVLSTEKMIIARKKSVMLYQKTQEDPKSA